MVQAERGDVRVVDAWTGDAALDDQAAERRPVVGAFAQQHQRWRLEPGVDLDSSLLRRARASPDSRMSDDSDELVDRGPRNGPRSRLLGEPLDHVCRWLVPRRV